MNKKGFTLVELLATIIILSLVTGIAIVTLTASFKKAKEDTENVFIKNLEDAIEIYMDSIVSNDQAMVFKSTKTCSVEKRFGTSYIHPASANTSANIKLSYLSDPKKNPYSPLGTIVNPANENVDCKPGNTVIRLYRDDDYVYYYFIEKSQLKCLLDQTGYITNLPCECIDKVISGGDKTLLPRCRT